MIGDRVGHRRRRRQQQQGTYVERDEDRRGKLRHGARYCLVLYEARRGGESADDVHARRIDVQIGPLRPAPRGSRLEHARSSVLGGPERDSQSLRHQALRSGRTPGRQPSALSTQDTSGAQRRGHLELATARESEARARAQDASRHPQPASQCARRRARVLGLGSPAHAPEYRYIPTRALQGARPPCPQRTLAPGSLSRAQLPCVLRPSQRSHTPAPAPIPLSGYPHKPRERRAGRRAGACVRPPPRNACAPPSVPSSTVTL